MAYDTKLAVCLRPCCPTFPRARRNFINPVLRGIHLSPRDFRNNRIYHYFSIKARCAPGLTQILFRKEDESTFAPRIRPAREMYLDVIMPWRIIFGRNGSAPSCASGHCLGHRYHQVSATTVSIWHEDGCEACEYPQMRGERQKSLKLLFVNPRKANITCTLRNLNMKSSISTIILRKYNSLKLTAARYHLAASFRFFLQPRPLA